MAVSAMYLVAVFGIFGSISGSVNRLSDGIAGIAALEVSGITDAGFPDTITGDVAAVPGVATAAPMIRMSASTASGPVLLFGADKSSAALGGALKDAVAATARRAVRGAGRCSGRAGCRSCERRQVPAGLGFGSQSRTVLGGKQLADLNGGHYVLAPLALAQNVTGRQGQLDSILITTKPGADLAAVRDAVTAAVNGRAIVADPSARATRAGDGVKMMNYMALMGAGGCLGRRRIPDLHHDDHGDHAAPAGHLDAARDRRPPGHNRSRHARGGGDSRTDRRRDRVGHRNTLGPHRDWSIAPGNDPGTRSSRRVLAARLRDTGRPRGDGAHQRGRVGDGRTAGVQGFTDRGVGTGRGVGGGLRAAMAADRHVGLERSRCSRCRS